MTLPGHVVVDCGAVKGGAVYHIRCSCGWEISGPAKDGMTPIDMKHELNAHFRTVRMGARGD